MQGERGCLPDEHTHLWLVEGTAMHLSWQALVAAGRARDRDAIAFARRMLRPGLRPLRDYERRGGADPEYALWHFAVRELVRERGERALVSFCRGVAAGRPWREAFTASFGESPSAFYARFAP